METFSKTSYSCSCPDSKLDRLSFASEGLWPCGAVSISKLWGKLMQKGWGNFQPGQIDSPPFTRILSPFFPGLWYQDRGQNTDMASLVLPVP